MQIKKISNAQGLLLLFQSFLVGYFFVHLKSAGYWGFGMNPYGLLTMKICSAILLISFVSCALWVYRINFNNRILAVVRILVCLCELGILVVMFMFYGSQIFSSLHEIEWTESIMFIYFCYAFTSLNSLAFMKLESSFLKAKTKL